MPELPMSVSNCGLRSINLTRREILGSAPALLSLFGGRLSATLDERNPSHSDSPSKTTIFVFVYGGISHVDSFDPKPDAPSSFRSQFEPISTASTGLSFTNQLPELARISDGFTVVRNISHAISEHSLATQYVLSGESLTATAAPGMGAHLSARFGTSIPPHHIAVPHIEGSAGSLGPAHEACSIFGDAGNLIRGAESLIKTDNGTNWARRRSLLSGLNQLRRKDKDAVKTDRDIALERALGVLESDRMRKLIDTSTIDQPTRQLYGDLPFATNLILARRFAEAGSRFIAVRHTGFDHHTNIFKFLGQKLPPLDRGIAGLITDLKQRGMLDTTSVFVTTEFGRAPRVNSLAGRDHWPRAATYLCTGGGLVRGKVIGRTDATGSEPVDTPIRPKDLAATLLNLHGLDATQMFLPGSGGRVLPGAKVVRELLERSDV